MGFMDKAKKMAEQAQTKLEEVQKQFNESQSSSGTQPPVEYDQHGRPIRSEAPAEPVGPPPAAPTPPHGDPVAGQPAEPPKPRDEAPTPDPAAPEDRNHPSHEPPKLSHGDPLAG
jgi:hypothetical protein